MSVTQQIQAFMAIQAQATTQAILQQVSAFGFNDHQITGGIGYLRSKGQLNIVSKLPYGHIFS